MTLLRHTTSEVKERTNLTVNPAKTCQPIGAMYAALGLHGCLPHSHGSQGCCSYHRSTLTRHYKEPVMAATSSFTEGSSVFGGQSNLVSAIDTIFTTYDPDVIAVHTTCLSETIGDDIPQIIEAAKDKGNIPEGKHVIHCNTPSYVGSHVTGFANMTTGFVKYFAEKTDEKTDTLNLIPGWVEPGDIREMKRIAEVMGVNTITFPDTSGVLDAPQTDTHEMYPKGGTTVDELKRTGASKGTVALGSFASGPAASELEINYGVPNTIIDLPIGVQATDRYVQALAEMASVDVPASLTDERGRLVDMIIDMHQYTAGKRVAVFGDPDQLISICEFLVALDMKPVYVVTGTPGKAFLRRMKQVLGTYVPEAEVAQGNCADMLLLHQLIKKEPVDLLIGNTYGKYIARDEDIPFVRHGFPILDRQGHQHLSTCGYLGGIRLLEKILTVLMDRQDRDSPEESFELTM